MQLRILKYSNANANANVHTGHFGQQIGHLMWRQIEQEILPWEKS